MTQVALEKVNACSGVSLFRREIMATNESMQVVGSWD
jgi:hypothetical protein